MLQYNEFGDWVFPDEDELALQDEKQANRHLLKRASAKQLKAFASHDWQTEEAQNAPQTLTNTCTSCRATYCTTWASENEFLTFFEEAVLKPCTYVPKSVYELAGVTYTICSPEGPKDTFPT